MCAMGLERGVWTPELLSWISSQQNKNLRNSYISLINLCGVFLLFVTKMLLEPTDLCFHLEISAHCTVGNCLISQSLWVDRPQLILIFSFFNMVSPAITN